MILLDTHVLLWLIADAQKISAAGHLAIANARRENIPLAVSSATLLEISILMRKKRIHLGAALQELLADIEAKFVVLPILSRACVRLLELPAAYPSDPVDQIIGATAIVEGIPLVTADEKIRKARAFATIW
jgi:PIN domain nuclease of toxin-antitoxin system